VVLVRQGQREIEVLLVRRDDRIAFMGGAHVFPGGRVEARDSMEPASSSCAGIDAVASRMRTPRIQAMSFHVAAVRELFEEAGVLLARNERGALLTIRGGASPHFDQSRRDLAAGDITLIDLLRAERLHLACDDLAYFAHWVTPAIETRRFDARFFMATAPPAQDASHDNAELTHSVWTDPARAIDACRRGDIALPPPTWTTLRWLSAFEDVEAAMRWARTRVVARVEPGFVQQGDTRIVLLPGDPDCPPVEGFEAPDTRFILEGGRWRPAPRSR
jgi:8-oxo-dGTP pyrophosphatase MutT (NUDIX family)